METRFTNKNAKYRKGIFLDGKAIRKEAFEVLDALVFYDGSSSTELARVLGRPHIHDLLTRLALRGLIVDRSTSAGTRKWFLTALGVHALKYRVGNKA